MPFRFHGLYATGCAFSILNFVIFVLFCAAISLRFYDHPGAFKASLLHPTESLFVPAVMISVGTILINITEFGLHRGETGYWLTTGMVVCFWIYVAVSILFSAGIYLIM